MNTFIHAKYTVRAAATVGQAIPVKKPPQQAPPIIQKRNNSCSGQHNVLNFAITS